MEDSKWFRTDVGPHFLDCLFFSERQLLRVESDSREWPWAILGLAATVQAACVLYLDERDTMCVSALSKKCQAKTIEASQFGSSKKAPKPFMAPPKELLERVQQGESAVLLSKQSRNDLHALMDFRHEFTHLKPNGWSIEISGLPRIANEAFSMIVQVLEKPGLYCNRISSDERIRALKSCKFGMKFCESLGIIL